MDDASLLKRLGRVTAPPDFERRVMAHLARRRAELPQTKRAQAFRYSLAGAAAVFLVCFLALNIFVLRNGPLQTAGRNAAGIQSAREFIPITEAVDYRKEIQNASLEPRTVFILEQISNASNRYINY